MWHHIKICLPKIPKWLMLLCVRTVSISFGVKLQSSDIQNALTVETKSLIVNPSEISINEREKMWRFLNDE